MKRAESIIMWIGAIACLIFGITQTAAALIRGEWFVAFCFAAMIAISKGMMQALDAENRKEEGNDGDQTER